MSSSRCYAAWALSPDVWKAHVRRSSGGLFGGVMETVISRHGAAGSGKSAIARTIAEMWTASDRLATKFFFFRGAGRRSSITHFISTLAYNLAFSVPATRPYIESALQKDHHIVYRSVDHHFRTLVADPIRSVIMPPLPMVVVVDALD